MNTFPVRSSIPSIRVVQGVWTGAGGVANCTKAAADWSRGISSIAYNAATGKYKVTFASTPGQQIVFGDVLIAGIAGSVGKVVNVIRSTYSPSLRTVDIEAWTPATDLVAAALVALATTDKLMCRFEFSVNAPDV